MSGRIDPESSPGGGEDRSLAELAQAFAQVMNRQAAPGEEGPPADLPPVASAEPTTGPEEGEQREADARPAFAVNPAAILEAMLFVGAPDGQPLTPARAAELMRGITAGEIPSLVEELNHRYAAEGCPYEVIGAGSGYRLTLRTPFDGIRRRFQGRMREVRLSQAAIDVLAIVAYRQPIARDEIARLRGRPVSHLLAGLVRRGLLSIARPSKGAPPVYTTTAKFLALFNLSSLTDLPQGEDPLESH